MTLVAAEFLVVFDVLVLFALVRVTSRRRRPYNPLLELHSVGTVWGFMSWDDYPSSGSGRGGRQVNVTLIGVYYAIAST